MDSGSLGTALMFFSLRVRGSPWFLPPLNFLIGRYGHVALSWKTFRIVAAKKLDEAFAHLATKIENFAGLGAADERAHFDCCLPGVRDL